MTAALEQTQNLEYLLSSLDVSMPDVLVVPEMLSDEHTRLRAAEFIGSSILRSGGSVEYDGVKSPIGSLYEAIHMARTGNKTARSLIEANVTADVIERTIKTGHVMSPVKLAITADGKIVQHGQSMGTIQANSLRYATHDWIMRLRTEAETRNAFRVEELSKTGFFDDYSFVVFSRAENLPNAGFFTETMSCAIQVTSKCDEGLATEAAFVAGIASPGGKQHDEATLIALGANLGADLVGKTPAEIIDTPLLVHNSLIPDGVINLVEMYDNCAGGTFFGEKKPRQEYRNYLEFCRQRQSSFKSKIQQITNELLAMASNIGSPLQATDMLHHLSEKHMVEHAVTDRSIDPRVFGSIAAPYIEFARLAVERGDIRARDVYIQLAKDTAQSNSCPGKGRVDHEPQDGDAMASNKGESDEDCDFISKKCPLCGEKNVKTRVTKTHIIGACGCKKKK